MTADFLSETMEAGGSGTISITERKALSTANLVAGEIFFRKEGTQRHLQKMENKKESIRNPALKGWLNNCSQQKGNNKK